MSSRWNFLWVKSSFRRAKDWYSKEEWEKSLEEANHVLAKVPDNVSILDLVSRIGLKTQDWQLTVDACFQLIENGHGAEKYFSRLIRAAQQLGVKELLVRIAELENAPRSLKDRMSVAARIAAGDYDGALELLAEGLSRSPDELLLLRRKASVLLQKGDLQGVIECCERILTLFPGDRETERIRLAAGQKLWSKEVLRKELQKALEAYPGEKGWARLKIQLLYFGYGDYREALKATEDALSRWSHEVDFLLFKCFFRLKLGEQAEAKSQIAEILRQFPENENAMLLMAQVERQLENKKEQLAWLNRVLARNNLCSLASKSNDSISIDSLFSAEGIPVEGGPLVSVVMTTYQGDPKRVSAIQSILQQTYQNLELIVVDDCSADGSFEELKQFVQEDQRVRVLQTEKNSGTYVAKNLGIANAKGDFVTFMDSDDYSHPQRIERAVKALTEQENAIGFTHNYFRVDGDCNIEFRGNKSIRKAFVSLCVRKEVFDKIGFFDSVRVGADGEFLERIHLAFGLERIVHERAPLLIATYHAGSLTGGGEFQMIPWRSVTGARFQYQTSFRRWHRLVNNREETPYLPRRIRVRPFEAPETMKADSLAWESSMPLFSMEIQRRKEKWADPAKAPWQAELDEKLVGRAFAEKHGVKVPQLLWEGEDIRDLPLFKELPENCVIKPDDGWNANHVFVLQNGYNLLDQKNYSREEIIETMANDSGLQERKSKFMVEELLVPESGQKEGAIPRDIKFYCFGGEIALVHVALRRSEVDKSQNVHQYFDRDFNLIRSKIMNVRPVRDDVPAEKPECWDELIWAVQSLGKALGIYMRIDMFATNRGAVFGEFTPTPHGGKGYSTFGERYLGSFWRGEEGA